MNMDFIEKLPIPMEIKARYPLPEEAAVVKAARDEAIRNIFTGKDDRLLLVIGPCSADSEAPVTEYLRRLRGVQDEVESKIVIVPRLYTNKPRTTGEGYKGLLHYPNPTEKPDLIKGVIATRKLHMMALTKFGFSCADEMLYPENHRYLNDLLAYVAVGARSVENQQHRLTASGLNIPVGMKNPMGGDLSAMLNAIHTAQAPHTFCYRGWEVKSHGNPCAHAILRGYTNREGQTVPNCGYEDLLTLWQAYTAAELANPAVIVDTNHANSGKQYDEQPRIAREVMAFRRRDPRIRALVKGFMIESYLEDGCQRVGEDVFGKSITDPCLGWEKTRQLIYALADGAE